MFPFEGAVEGSLERSRGDRVHVQHETPDNNHADRVTPLSGTQLPPGELHPFREIAGDRHTAAARRALSYLRRRMDR
jgi:hypothetical protein